MSPVRRKTRPEQGLNMNTFYIVINTWLTLYKLLKIWHVYQNVKVAICIIKGISLPKKVWTIKQTTEDM